MGGENKMFRCRLRSAWSLPAKVAFWGLCGFELLIIGLISSDLPYIWMLLLTLPIFGWYSSNRRNRIFKGSWLGFWMNWPWS